jgi:hypothetical protein
MPLMLIFPVKSGTCLPANFSQTDTLFSASPRMTLNGLNNLMMSKKTSNFKVKNTQGFFFEWIIGQ